MITAIYITLIDILLVIIIIKLTINVIKSED